MKKFNPLFLLFVFTLTFSPLLSAATNDFTPGLHGFDFRKGQYQVYIPTNYNPENQSPLIMISYMYDGIPKNSPSHLLESWSKVADEKGYVVVMANAGGIDIKINEWYIDLIKFIKKRYSINSSKILITGFGESGDFAAFFGTNHPEMISAFSSVASTHNLWGKMSNYRSERKPSHFISIGDDKIAKPEKIEAFAEKLKKKGYLVTLEKIETGGHAYTDEMTAKISAWFQAL